MKIEVLHHASVKLTDKKTIYFDPYLISDKTHDADYIFITHDHYDHYDALSIKNISNENTKIIVPTCLKDEKCDLVVEPNKSYKIDDISFETVRAYNVNKSFHLREKDYVGYIVLLKGVYYYIMGDTDRTMETDAVTADICFVPIGGTYTMNVTEAIEYIDYLKPTIAIPIHYGMITGSPELAEEFKNNVNKEIDVQIKINN